VCQKQPESVKLFSTTSTWEEALKTGQQRCFKSKLRLLVTAVWRNHMASLPVLVELLVLGTELSRYGVQWRLFPLHACSHFANSSAV
jgi:hypothetical protein